MLYSSGTTGHPKGIRRPLSGEPFGTAATLVPMLEQIMGFGAGDVYLSPAPLYHSAPLVWSMTVQRMGGTVVLLEHFDPEECLRLIEQYRVTHAQFVPTMFVRMLKLADEVRTRYDVSSLRSVVHAAAPCPPEVKRRMIEWWGPILHEYYSGTEGMGMTWITSAEALERPGLGRSGHLGRGAHLRRRRRGGPGRPGRRGLLRRTGRRHLRVQPRPREDPPDLQREGVGHPVGRGARR